MSKIARCRECGTPRWRTDPCVNPDCPRVVQAPVVTKPQHTIHGIKSHGFHAGVAAYRLLDEYDQPIHARRWQSAS